MESLNVSDISSKRNSLSSDGFTVIETLISILLFALALMGGIAVYFNAGRINAMAVHKKIATEVVSSTMEELRRQGYVAFCEGYGNSLSDCQAGPPDLSGTPAIGLLTSLETITFSSPTEAGVPADYRVAAAVLSWTEAGQADPRNVTVTSYVAP